MNVYINITLHIFVLYYFCDSNIKHIIIFSVCFRVVSQFPIEVYSLCNKFILVNTVIYMLICNDFPVPYMNVNVCALCFNSRIFLHIFVAVSFMEHRDKYKLSKQETYGIHKITLKYSVLTNIQGTHMIPILVADVALQRVYKNMYQF